MLGSSKRCTCREKYWGIGEALGKRSILNAGRWNKRPQGGRMLNNTCGLAKKVLRHCLVRERLVLR